jgi:hypothetical protein
MIWIVHWRNPPAKLLCVGCEISAWLSCRIILSFIQFLGSLWFSQLSTLAWSSYVGFLIVVYKLIGGSIKISFLCRFCGFRCFTAAILLRKTIPNSHKAGIFGISHQSMGWNGHCIRVFEESIKAVLWRNPPCCEALYRNTVLWAPRGWYHLRFSKFKQKCSLAYPPYSIRRNGLLFFENQTKVSFGLPSIDGETLRSPGWIFFFVFLTNQPIGVSSCLVVEVNGFGKFFNGPLAYPPYDAVL